MIGIVTEGFYGYQPTSIQLINTGGAPAPTPEPPEISPVAPDVLAAQLTPPSVSGQGQPIPSVQAVALKPPTLLAQAPSPDISNTLIPPLTTVCPEFLTSELVVAADIYLADDLGFKPINPLEVKLWLNGFPQDNGPGLDFEIIGRKVLWLAGTGTAADLAVTDVLTVEYERLL